METQIQTAIRRSQMNLTKKILLALMAVAMLATVFLETATAQTDHGGHGAGAMTTASHNAASGEYKAAMDKMHAAMSAQQYTGNADVDFAAGMIPHHQAAIDMAKTVLKYGKDPEIRKLAKAVVSAQEAEIKQLEDWLKNNPAN
jgi:uncharacterized protein (DUF305 family)